MCFFGHSYVDLRQGDFGLHPLPVTYGPLSPASRAIPATFLVAMALAAGAVKSAFPRLAQACRMACITAVFLLTQGVGDSQVPFTVCTDFLVVSITAALYLSVGDCTVPSAIIPIIVLSVDVAFRLHPASSEKPLPLLNAPSLVPITQLHRAYIHAFFELRYSRLHIKELHAFVDLIERLRSEFSWGSTIPTHLRTSRVSHLYSAFKEPSVIMTDALCDALQLLEYTISYTFDVPLADPPLKDPPDSLSYTKHQKAISEAMRLLKLQLGMVHASLDRTRSDVAPPDSHSAVDFSKEVFAISLFTISLLQIASDLIAALKLAQSIAEKFQSRKRRRLWLPKLTKAWFSSRNPTPNWDSMDHDADEFDRDYSDGPYPSEQRKDIVEEEVEETSLDPNIKKKIVPIHSYRDIRRYLKGAWASVLEPRIRFSKSLHSLRHSPHPRYAFKNAFGVALLSLPAFLPSENYWFTDFYAHWTIATYVFVLETNTGATIRTGALRLIGTFCGVIFAYVAWVISNHNPIGIVIMIILSDLPISWLILRTHFAPIGVVASVTIPPVLYTNFQRVARRPNIRLRLRLYLPQKHITQNFTRQLINGASSTSPDERRVMKLEDDILIDPSFNFFNGAWSFLLDFVEFVNTFRKRRLYLVSVFSIRLRGHFRTGESVPQFLPSPQHALRALEFGKAAALHLGAEATTSPSVGMRGRKSLSTSFALAENALMEELVSCLDRLLDITRKLYGTVSWAVDAGLEKKWDYEMVSSSPSTPILREGPMIAWSGPGTPSATPAARLSPAPSLRYWV
ncbi:hypothetical protein BS47DRAFT_1385984 [Hydnum rufescens UP504]|uniref:Integral membrane bound transporter domain-containing protein n=1 Tax=Hydnum rufescens UP504 TaxID=1448309 RepID=A0A9P6DIJ9_9AGAM|nr:hypothetical protein BS47DRAFT_1385984 [Hydnum rufescens UP504]